MRHPFRSAETDLVEPNLATASLDGTAALLVVDPLRFGRSARLGLDAPGLANVCGADHLAKTLARILAVRFLRPETARRDEQFARCGHSVARKFLEPLICVRRQTEREHVDAQLDRGRYLVEGPMTSPSREYRFFAIGFDRLAS